MARRAHWPSCRRRGSATKARNWKQSSMRLGSHVPDAGDPASVRRCSWETRATATSAAGPHSGSGVSHMSSRNAVTSEHGARTVPAGSQPSMPPPTAAATSSSAVSPDSSSSAHWPPVMTKPSTPTTAWSPWRPSSSGSHDDPSDRLKRAHWPDWLVERSASGTGRRSRGI